MKEPQHEARPNPDSASHAGAGSTTGQDRPDARLWIGAVAVSLIVLFVLQRQTAFVVDDAFITFRFARNWAEWGAPVFNAFELAPGGQPVEGYSNFLWVGCLALLHRVGFDLPVVTSLAQVVLAGATVLLVARVARRQLELGAVGQVAAPLLLATSAPFVAWSGGGMETTLFTLLLTAFLFGLLDRSGSDVRRGVLLGALGAGVVLVRVEGLLWVGGALIAVMFGEWLRSGEGLHGLTRRRRTLLIAFTIVGVVFVAQLLWRRSLYGEWLPNTVTAKTGGGTDVMGRGARQIASWAIVCITPLAALVAAVPALRRGSVGGRVAAATCIVFALGFTAYSVLIGGDWMPFFRFLAPAAPVLALLVAIGLDAVPRPVAIAVGMALVVVQPLALFDVHVAPEGLRESLRFRTFRDGYATEAGRAVKARENARRFERLGHALAAGTVEGDVLAFGPIGSPGWYAPTLDFVDRNGLVTPSVAARAVQAGGGTAGHEKRVPHAWFLENGTPRPNLLFATWVEGLMDPGIERQVGQAKAAIRGLLGNRPRKEGPLYAATVLRAVPVHEGPAAGCTLLLLERASAKEARRCWGE